MSRVRSAVRRRLFREGMALALAATASVASKAQAEPEAAAPAATSEPAARHGSAFIDPLGFALFGPRLGVEAAAGHFSIAAHARWFNAGLLAHSLFLKSGDSFGFSYGGGLRARYWLDDIGAGTHFGLVAEALRIRIENSDAQVATNSTYFVPYAEVGYRLPLGGFYADGAAGIGYAFRLSGNVENLPGGSSASLYQAEDKSTVYGTASLDLGVFF
jgi:hypothetical protein